MHIDLPFDEQFETSAMIRFNGSKESREVTIRVSRISASSTSGTLDIVFSGKRYTRGGKLSASSHAIPGQMDKITPELRNELLKTAEKLEVTALYLGISLRPWSTPEPLPTKKQKEHDGSLVETASGA